MVCPVREPKSHAIPHMINKRCLCSETEKHREKCSIHCKAQTYKWHPNLLSAETEPEKNTQIVNKIIIYHSHNI